MLKAAVILMLLSAVYSAWGAWSCRRNRENFTELIEEGLYLFTCSLVASFFVFGFVVGVIYVFS